MPAVPLKGDRSAHNMLYPNLHASDIEEGNLRYHTPAPAEAGVVLYSPDGVRWTSYKLSQVGQGGIQTRMTILTFPKDLEVQVGLLRVHNLFGITQSISKIFLSVSDPSETDDIIVDVLQNGISLFTDDDHKPSIVAGELTGYTELIDRYYWYAESYITADIEQCGISSNPGKNMTVHIVHTDSSGRISVSAPCYIRGGSEGELDAAAHCYVDAIGADELRVRASCFIQTPTWDIDESAHCFIQAIATPLVNHAHAFVLPLGYASMGLSRSRTLQDSANPVGIYVVGGYNTKRQFLPELEDPDTYIYINNGYWLYAVRYSGIYEITGYLDCYNTSYCQLSWAEYEDGDHNVRLRHEFNPLGTSGGVSANWRDRSVAHFQWVEEFTGNSNLDYADWISISMCRTASPQIAVARTDSFAPRIIIRRLT